MANKGNLETPPNILADKSDVSGTNDKGSIGLKSVSNAFANAERDTSTLNLDGQLFGYAYNKNLEVNKIKDSKGNQKLTIQGSPSLMNKYAVFCLMGSDDKFMDFKKMRDSGNSMSNNIITPGGSSKSTSSDSNGNSQDSNGITSQMNGLGLSTAHIIEKMKDTPEKRLYFSDFCYCKYFGLIPNNRLLILRRFYLPVIDNLQFPDGKRFAPIAQAVSYYGEESENPLSSLLNFSVSMNWEEVNSNVHEVDGNEPGFSDNPLFKFMGSKTKGVADTTAGVLLGGDLTKGSDGRSRTGDQQDLSRVDNFDKMHPNEVYGPVNVIDKTHKRGRGMDFENDLKITFEYNLRSIGNINPKAAFIDILCNMLALTYNSAPWWGGETKYYPNVNTAPFMGDYKAFYEGRYGEYFKTLGGDIGKLAKTLKANLGEFLNKPKDANAALEKIGKLAGGGISLLADILQRNNRPSMVVLNALVSGAPVGEWHLTIGNPLNPLQSIGNLILKKTEFEFSDDIGYDEVPQSFKVVLHLEHGKPRDSADIQSMWNKGQGRVYQTIKNGVDILNSSAATGTRIIDPSKQTNNGIPKKCADNPNDYYDLRGNRDIKCYYNGLIQGFGDGFRGDFKSNSVDQFNISKGGLWGKKTD